MTTLGEALDALMDMDEAEAFDVLAFISGADPELFAKIIEYRDERRRSLGQ